VNVIVRLCGEKIEKNGGWIALMPLWSAMSH